jgi:hypothetical protein
MGYVVPFALLEAFQCLLPSWRVRGALESVSWLPSHCYLSWRYVPLNSTVGENTESKSNLNKTLLDERSS